MLGLSPASTEPAAVIRAGADIQEIRRRDSLFIITPDFI
jgi:hypothetical protein